MPPDLLLCRFCAKRRTKRSIIELKIGSPKQRGIAQKLSIFCEGVVDFTDLSLPQNICKICFSYLDTSNEFFKSAKKAQEILVKYFKSVDVKECDINLEPPKPEFDTVAVGVDIESKPPLLAWASYPWCCFHCNTYITTAKELIQHSQDVHDTCCAFKCDDCAEEPVGFEEFVDHVRGHRPYLKDYCPHCNIAMASSSHLDTHKSEYNCTFCGQYFKHESHLLAHLKKYVPKMSKNTELLDIIEDIDVEGKNLEEREIKYSDRNTDLNIFVNDMFDTYDDAVDMQDDNSQIDSKVGDALQNDSFMPGSTSQLTEMSKAEELLNKNESLLEIALSKRRTKVKKNKKKKIAKNQIKSKIMKIDIASQIKTRRSHVIESNPANDSFKQENSHEAAKKIHKQKYINENDQNIDKPERKESIDEYSPDEDEISSTDDDEGWREDVFKKKKKPKLKVVIPEELLLWSQYPIVCRYCDDIFKNRDILRMHSIKMHSNCFGMKCVDCKDDESENIDQFTLHVVTHRPDLRFVCYWCDKFIKDSTHLQEHMKKLHCNICGHNFSTKLSLVNHWEAMGVSKQDIEKLLEESNTKSQCEICKEYVDDLPKHKRSHQRTRDHTCEVCGKSFYEASALSKHVTIHDPSQRMQCNISGIFKQNKSRLKKHITTHNLSLKFQCDHCKKFFPNKSYLRDHIIKHIDKKDFESGLW